MQQFIKNFVREPDGAWRYIAHATLQTSSGRVQVTPGSRFAPGTVFIGVDLAGWLDHQAAGVKAGPGSADRSEP